MGTGSQGEGHRGREEQREGARKSVLIDKFLVVKMAEEFEDGDI